MFFGSDNTGPVAPQVMEALNAANQGYSSAYGRDALMDQVRDRLRVIFEAPQMAVQLVATGTAANSLALSLLAKPWDMIFCHEEAHVHIDECNAPEFFTGGAKLTTLSGEHGKIDADDLRAKAKWHGMRDVHWPQPGALTVTNVNEAGGVYSLEHMRSLTAIAKSHGMRSHLDGARFANAMVALDCTPAEMTWKSGFDVVSFGGTKNGLMGVEAVLMFDPELAWEFELRRKRAGHLFSKHRFLSAQMLAYLTDDLWIDLATKSNAAAGRLATGLQSMNHANLIHPQQANMVFAEWPREAYRHLSEAGAVVGPSDLDHSLEGPDDTMLPCRMVCNWATTDDNIQPLLDLVRG